MCGLPLPCFVSHAGASAPPSLGGWWLFLSARAPASMAGSLQPPPNAWNRDAYSRGWRKCPSPGKVCDRYLRWHICLKKSGPLLRLSGIWRYRKCGQTCSQKCILLCQNVFNNSKFSKRLSPRCSRSGRLAHDSRDVTGSPLRPF